ncbi:TetR/AcrR family transcriptional regulator [Clostridium beijerinckii]|jgi:AcrR family transcriptional regulator|uniref:TetR/AcrR family transcriptional regulator n=2 Tax=Clostridium beijerinckii TaxID=1520 RepID=A0AAE2RP72_CLOBE|nr:TetR/AcrR family transcriptional regulator [Clostridium beijerinckii]ABR32774.1 transcriptional regulator, TetR family [Clostridium beijerinckii NCIMB 8052]AIU03654.1 TetR family transcriptional regulator [Clostridium beijerinckii ATCC 35702]MBF7807547.1 TetR/AcrR family transcriptional regulator [Clostridium beijerinckii]NOW88168.1 AcrR family transcriptional regulator [Clostridium beijerinckii]NRT25990.1 AcrR family transcriptional regulator [Clostridium beijerinckii]
MTLKNNNKSLTQNKKQLKEEELFLAAYDLFLKNGIEKTSIDDITKNAKVAKGTFYLYFSDKYDILNKLILQKSNEIIREGLAKTNAFGSKNFKERTLFFIDYIINYLKDNVSLLKLINKNISWGLYRKAIMKPEAYNDVKKVLDIFVKNLTKSGMNEEEAEMTLFMIFELVGSICFTTIILKEPTDIESIKPILFKKILAMISV